MIGFQEKMISELIQEEAILAVQDGNHGEKHPKSSDYVENGIHFVMANDLGSGSIDLKGCNKIPENLASKLRIGFSKKGDVLLTHKGTIGNVAIVGAVEPYVMLTPQVTYYRTNDDKLSNRYLAYAFREPMFQKRMKSLAQQSTRPYIGITAQRNLKILWTDRKTQDSVVDILAQYDNLIENNKRRIELLEESARQLYKEWFVRFRFPGHEHVKIIDGVPEGWSRRPLGDLLEIKHGFAFKGEFFSDDPTPLILMTPGNFKIGGGIKLDKKKYYSEGAPIPEDYVLEENELLVTMTDLSKTSDTLGFPALVPRPNGRIFLHNQRLGKVSCKADSYFPKYYFYHVFLDNRYRAFVVGSASGTSVKHTSPKKILSYEHLMPNGMFHSMVQQFDQFAKGIHNQINNLITWNENLTKARDLLLPKLMNGEIAV